MTFVNENLTILYGSQTGNSQDVAERIWRESKRFYFQTTISCMDEFNVLNLINERCVIFVCSTTGQGEEPDNMKTFWKFLLRRNLPLDSLCNLKFGVLGLGDSSYSKFNFAAKRLYKRLQQLGGEAIAPLGLGDDQHDLGYDGTADPWIENLWNELLQLYPLPRHIQPLDRNFSISPRFNVHTRLLSNIPSVNKVQSIYYSTRRPTDFTVNVLENNRITDKDHFQDVRLVKLKTDGQPYQPGDVVVLRPRNLQWQVQELIDVFESNGVQIHPETAFSLTSNDPQMTVPVVLRKEVTLRQLFEEYFDLMAIPRRFTFNILAQLTDSELEKEKCLEFTTAEGQDELYTYCNRPKRNIVEVLRDFPHATKNITKDMLFELFSPIKPREFSIASSFKATPDEIHILLAVVKYQTKLKKERFGLCSNYLADLGPGAELTSWFKKGSFRFPRDNDTPVIMVGPGTGVAPFRSYIQECAANNSASAKNLLLFFGCRNYTKDFHCKEEFLQFEKDGKLNLICAFSRDQESKIYVQDKIVEAKVIVWDMLQRNGQIFVAGSAKNMPQEVRKSFKVVLQEEAKLSEADAEKYLINMEKTNRYQTECWS